MKQESKSGALILGCGYLGVRVGRILSSRGVSVVATTTRPDRTAELESFGFEPALLNFENFENLEESAVWRRGYEVVLCATAPGRGGSVEAVFHSGPVRCARKAFEAGAKRFVLVSTTGVYQQDDGSWVTEESPAKPSEGRYLTIRTAEDELLSLGASVLRLGGLYGPGRSPVEWLRRPEMRGRILQGSREAWMNWIRVEDAADLCALVLDRGAPGTIYLGVDGHPVRRGDFYRFAAEQAGLAPPDLPSGLPGMGKRCDNRSTRAWLGFQPRFLTYRAGLTGL